MDGREKKSNPGKCPICEAPIDRHFRPFCSKHCANVDLGRWLTGKYVVTGSEDAEEDGGFPVQERTHHEFEDEEPDPDPDLDVTRH